MYLCMRVFVYLFIYFDVIRNLYILYPTLRMQTTLKRENMLKCHFKCQRGLPTQLIAYNKLSLLSLSLCLSISQHLNAREIGEGEGQGEGRNRDKERDREMDR